MILVGALGAQLVDLDGLGLADAVDARHRLHVRVRVGARVRAARREGARAPVSQEGATRYSLPLLLTSLLYRLLTHLHVVLRVPVGVEDDDGVGRREVDPHAARARREDEDERVRVLVGEAVDRLLPLCAGHGAVEPLEAPALCIEDVGHEVEHLGELREDEDAVAVGLELGQQLAQQDELAW